MVKSGKTALVLGLFATFFVAGCDGVFKLHRGERDGAGSTTKIGNPNCVDPDLSKVASGKQLTMCDGSIGVGTRSAKLSLLNCKKTGDTDCITTAEFPAADYSAISAAKIQKGTTFGQLTGLMMPIKRCKNGGLLSVLDISWPVTNLPLSFNTTGNIDTATEVINLGSTHGLLLDTPVRFTTVVSLPAPLVVGTTYYAIPVTGSTASFAATPGGAAIDLTSTGNNWMTVHPVANGTVDWYDNITDSSGGASEVTSNPWNASDALCGSSNFTNVSTETGKIPDDALAVAAGATNTWSQVWRDNLTGGYFTNVLAHQNKDWLSAVRICEGLNGGSAGSGWHLPTSKELGQLHVDGISRLPLAGGSLNVNFWSMTHHSRTSAGGQMSSWAPRLGFGYAINVTAKSTATMSVLCVRD